MPSSQYAIRNTVQVSRKATEYGSMMLTSVPMPVLFTYRYAYTTTSGKYGMSGVMMLVVESPTR